MSRYGRRASKNAKATKKRPGTLYLVVSLTIITLIISAVVFIGQQKLAQPNTPSEKAVTEKTARPFKEMEAFWKNELDDLVMKQWYKGKLPYPEINRRYKELHDQVIRKTGDQISMKLVKNYHWTGTDTSGGGGYTKSNLFEVELVIPTLMDTFEKLQRSDSFGWREAFTNHVIILLMHELEHSNKKVEKDVVDIEEESRAWAETCQHTILPLKDRYRQTMYFTDHLSYEAWTKSDGNVTHPVWITHIQERYSRIEGKARPHNPDK